MPSHSLSFLPLHCTVPVPQNLTSNTLILLITHTIISSTQPYVKVKNVQTHNIHLQLRPLDLFLGLPLLSIQIQRVLSFTRENLQYGWHGGYIV